MNKSSIIIALLAAILAMSTSCRSAQKAMVSETRSGEIAESVEADWSNSAFNPLTVAAAAPEWTDFSASGNITVSTTGSLSSAIQIKMVRGRSISISIRPLLGIEMGKLFVDKDSVTLVDKYHNIYVRESVSQLQRHRTLRPAESAAVAPVRPYRRRNKRFQRIPFLSHRARQ